MDKEYSCRIKQILEEGRRCKERLGVMGPTHTLKSESIKKML